MKYIFGSTIVIGFLLLTYSKSNAQTPQEYEVPIQFSITQTGINRFIASQWAGIQTSWSGTHEGLQYFLQLKKPSILLTSGNISIILEIAFSSQSYNATIAISPTLNISPLVFSADNLIASYVNLRNQIDLIAGITDPRVRDIIEQHLAPIDWIIYQGRIFDQSELRWTNTADIKWAGLPEVSFSVNNEELIITLTPIIYATKPYYLIYIRIHDYGYYGLKILSNNYFKLERQTLQVSGTGVHVFEPVNTIILSEYDDNNGQYYIELINPGMNISNTMAVSHGLIISRENSKMIFNRNYAIGNIIPNWEPIITNYSSY